MWVHLHRPFLPQTGHNNGASHRHTSDRNYPYHRQATNQTSLGKGYVENDVKKSMEKVMTAYAEVGASKYAKEVSSPLVLWCLCRFQRTYEVERVYNTDTERSACPRAQVPLTPPLVSSRPSLHPLRLYNRRFGPKCWRARRTILPSSRKDVTQCSSFRIWPRDRSMTPTIQRTVVGTTMELATCVAKCLKRSLRKMKLQIRLCLVPHRCILSAGL